MPKSYFRAINHTSAYKCKRYILQAASCFPVPMFFVPILSPSLSSQIILK